MGAGCWSGDVKIFAADTSLLVNNKEGEESLITPLMELRGYHAFSIHCIEGLYVPENGGYFTTWTGSADRSVCVFHTPKSLINSNAETLAKQRMKRKSIKNVEILNVGDLLDRRLAGFAKKFLLANHSSLGRHS